MSQTYLLLPSAALDAPEDHPRLVARIVAGWVALWEPALLVESNAIPRLWALGDAPPGDPLALAVPDESLGERPALERQDLAALGSRLITVTASDSADEDGADRLAALARGGRPAPPESTRDLALALRSLAWQRLGIGVTFRTMSQPGSLDEEAFAADVVEAARGMLDGDADRAKLALEAAYQRLLDARQIAYPATIHWLDLALAPPGFGSSSAERLSREPALNLVLTGGEVERLDREEPELVARIRDAALHGRLEIVSGRWDDRSWEPLGVNQRLWQLSRTAAIVDRVFQRPLEHFGSRRLFLSPELPQLLGRFDARDIVHAAWDGSRFPQFKDPRVQWTAPDGSVVDALTRPGVNAGDESMSLEVFRALGRTIMKDRSATVALSHWIEPTSLWYRRLIRGAEFLPTLGSIVTLGDYFMATGYADTRVTTRPDEYVETAGAGPVFASNDRATRGAFEAAAMTAGLARMLAPDHPDATDWPALEDRLETSARTGSLPDFHALARTVAAPIADLVLTDAEGPGGWLAINPLNSPRRDWLDLPPLASGSHPESVAVDLPAWGFAWIPADAAGQPRPIASSKAPVAKPTSPVPPAAGRKFRNPFVEAELDPKTGGLRGIWQPRSGYIRLGQQLAADPDLRIEKVIIRTENQGASRGRIIAEGRFVDPATGASRAEFRQTFQLEADRPTLELDVEIRPVIVKGNTASAAMTSSGGAAATRWLSRWAWPDDRANLRAGSGHLVESVHGERFSAGDFFEVRERHLAVAVFTGGPARHERFGPRILDTELTPDADGIIRRRFRIVMDLGAPAALAMALERPPTVLPMPGKAPRGATAGWFLRLADPTIVCLALMPIRDEQIGPALRFTLVETAGKQTRTELRFARTPTSVRLINGRGTLQYELYLNGDTATLDFSPGELMLLEARFAESPTGD